MKKSLVILTSLMFIVIFALSFGCSSVNQGEKGAAVNGSSDDKAAGDGSAKYLINDSKIYQVEKDAVWTTTLNMLQVITRFTVTGQTVIYLDGKPAGLEQLKPGFKVTIYYYKSSSGTASAGSYAAVKILAYSRYSVQ